MIYLVFMRFAEEDGPNATDGPFESVQITYDIIRDENGRAIAKYRREEGWFREGDRTIYSDIVIETQSGS